MDAGSEVGRDQIEDVAAVAGRAIRPESGLVAGQHHLEAVAGTAQHVADEKLALALLARREHRGQHRLQPCDQFRANFVAFSIPVFDGQGNVVEVDHSAPSSGVLLASRPCGALLLAAHAESSDIR